MEQAQFRLHESSLGLLTRPPNALDHLLPPLLPGLQHHHHPGLHHPGLASTPGAAINSLPGFLAAHHPGPHHAGYSSYLTPPTSSPLASAHPGLTTGGTIFSTTPGGSITPGSLSSASLAAAGVAAAAAAGIASGIVAGGPHPPPPPPSHPPSSIHPPPTVSAGHQPPGFPPSPPLGNDTRLSPGPNIHEEDFRSTSIVALRLKAREHMEVLGKTSTMV